MWQKPQRMWVFKKMNKDIPKTSEPAKRAFIQADIKTINDFSKWTKEELLQLHGVGPKAIKILKENGVKFKNHGR